MRSGRPVARLLAPVVTRVLVLVLLLGAIAIAGIGVSMRAVQTLTTDLQPAAAANQDVLQDLTEMQGTLSAYAQAGQQSALDGYGQALARLAGHEQRVRRYAAGDAELDLLVARQEQTAEAWLDEYAAVRVERPGGPGSFDRELFRTGLQRLATFRAAHAETTAAFDARVRDARDETELRLRGTILGVLLVAALGAWGVARARRRLQAQVADPLTELEQLVQRMAAGHDRGARAPENGPREVRTVAAALNELVEDRARARAVEARIQSELRSLDTARDDFVSNVSHELRTPLTTISGYLELVAEEFEGQMTPRHEKMVQATRRNVARLRQLIDDLLTLSRTEASDAELEQLDLGAVVRDVLADVRLTAARRGIRFEATLPPGVLLILGDRVMLHRALLNVVTNAVKFSRDDSSVEVGASRQGDGWTVVVTDHGIGIPAEQIDRLGTRFFRASNAVTNEIAGTGLGIRIVQTIVDKHSGDLVIDSEEGSGTTVTLRLPAHDELDDPGPGAATPPTLRAVPEEPAAEPSPDEGLLAAAEPGSTPEPGQGPD